MNGSNQNVIVICCFFSLGPKSGMAKCSPFWAGHGSTGYVFRASFARLSRTFRSKSKKKMNRYYLLSGLSRIFRKPFANVYISRKVPFAQTSQIYACGPRLYKPFMGFCTTLIYIGDSFWGLYPLLLSSFRAQFHRPMSCSHLLLAGSLVFATFCDDAKCRFMRVPW